MGIQMCHQLAKARGGGYGMVTKLKVGVPLKQLTAKLNRTITAAKLYINRNRRSGASQKMKEPSHKSTA